MKVEKINIYLSIRRTCVLLLFLLEMVYIVRFQTRHLIICPNMTKHFTSIIYLSLLGMLPEDSCEIVELFTYCFIIEPQVIAMVSSSMCLAWGQSWSDILSCHSQHARYLLASLSTFCSNNLSTSPSACLYSFVLLFSQ